MNLTIHQGNDVRPRGRGKTALCLCGGGITGALFEIGVMAALDDVVGTGAANHFDVYVGASAGASVATLLSQGVVAERAFRALHDPTDPYFALRREDVFGIELAPWLRAAGRMGLGAVGAFARRGSSEDRLADRLAALVDRLPAGLFRLDRFQRFLTSFFAREGLAREFWELGAELYVVANDVDTAERVIFGDRDRRAVSIAAAIAASSAIPLFFEPVQIDRRDYFDGGIGRVAHIDVAIDHGADRIVVVNPVVPIRNDTSRRIRSGGLLPVFNQAMRILNKARLHFGIKRYLAEHPNVEVAVLEPSADETLLFVHGSMGLGGRHAILDYARASGGDAWAGIRSRSILERTPPVRNDPPER